MVYVYGVGLLILKLIVQSDSLRFRGLDPLLSYIYSLTLSMFFMEEEIREKHHSPLI